MRNKVSRIKLNSSFSSKVSDRQGGLAFCSTWGSKELDTTEWLNWTELTAVVILVFWTSLPFFLVAIPIYIPTDAF